ncbi:hypothetical protein skT53_17440 [Effusibacillus dendaii]|uniref:DUF2179 domain-containing protein n=1 Tax=Effusibacillus dendaii TaxID=2743772 RepID=A0A7I8DCS9_9BACL|nr:hypothetical protein skT53_17440 [Effusibacillus dendaii]
MPNHIIDGGVTGVSIMLSHLTGMKLGVFLFLFNLPFLIIGYKQIGTTFAISTLFGVFVMSLGTALFLPVPSLTQVLLLSSVFGGIISGIGVGLVIRAGGSIEGLDQSRFVWIISEEYNEIGSTVSTDLGRGVTYLNGEGGYSGDVKKVIFCVITRLEEAKLKSIVDEIDPSSFLAIGNIHDVKGGRFKKKDIH